MSRSSPTRGSTGTPWTISIAAWAFSFATLRDGLVLSYVASMVAALVASLVPFVRTYGLPRGWTPRLAELLGYLREAP